MRISAGVDPLALSIQKQASEDRSSCLENPRPEGAESSLTENVTSPFQAEPAQDGLAYSWTKIKDLSPQEAVPSGGRLEGNGTVLGSDFRQRIGVAHMRTGGENGQG